MCARGLPFAVAVLIVLTVAPEARSEFWNNIGGVPPDDASRQAANAMFDSASSVFSALASLEVMNESNAMEQLEQAMSSVIDVIESLKSINLNDYENLNLSLSSDTNEREIIYNLAEEAGLLLEEIDTVDDVVTLSIIAVENYGESLSRFAESQDSESYAELRRNLGNALSVGQIGASLIQAAQRQ